MPSYIDPGLGPNDIGQFEIGVSPIGSIPAFDYQRTIISQFANSPVILQLLASYFAAIDPTGKFDEFFDKIWNVDTAEGYGLDVWGRIVGVVRNLAVQAGQFLGFEEANDPVNEAPFGQAPLYGAFNATSNFALSDSSFRLLILAKAAANICDGSIPAINKILMDLFPGRGNAYVVDNGGMSMTYAFSFVLTPVELAIVKTSGVLPKPAGVSVSVSGP